MILASFSTLRAPELSRTVGTDRSRQHVMNIDRILCYVIFGGYSSRSFIVWTRKLSLVVLRALQIAHLICMLLYLRRYKFWSYLCIMSGIIYRGPCSLFLHGGGGFFTHVPSDNYSLTWTYLFQHDGLWHHLHVSGICCILSICMCTYAAHCTLLFDGGMCMPRVGYLL